MSSQDKTILLHPVISSSEYLTAWKVSKYGGFSGPYFPAFELNRAGYGVSARIQSECGKYGPEKPLYLDTFHIVFVSASFKHIYNFFDKSQYRNNLKSNQKNPRTELPKRGVNLNYA